MYMGVGVSAFVGVCVGINSKGVCIYVCMCVYTRMSLNKCRKDN